MYIPTGTVHVYKHSNIILKLNLKMDLKVAIRKIKGNRFGKIGFTLMLSDEISRVKMICLIYFIF